MSVTAGGVGLCITDLLAYAKFHLGDGTAANGERVLTRASLELMRTPQLQKQCTDDDIGLGVAPAHASARCAWPRTAARSAGHILLLEIVPERNFAIGILTNSQNGWRLIQDVERAALRVVSRRDVREESGHRASRPRRDAAERRAARRRSRIRRRTSAVICGPMNAVEVRVDGGQLVVQEVPNSGDPRPEMPIAFFGPDRAVVTDGNDRGQSIEFIRDANGSVNWIRVVGRVAVTTP